MTGHAGVRIAPVVVWRRGTVPFACLRDLTPARTGDLVTTIHDGRLARAALRDGILAAVYEAVPRADRSHRRGLLHLSRALFNDRRPAKAAVAAAQSMLDGMQRAALESWLSHHDRERDLLRQARATLASELAGARRGLAALALGDDFRSAVQLLDATLHRKVVEFAERAGRSGQTPAALRTAERTVVSIAYRSALKPSPFGTLTTVGLWRDPGDGGDPRPVQRLHPGRTRLIRLNRSLLDWMTAALAGVPEVADLLEVRLANTAVCRGGSLEFLAASEESASAESASAESGGPGDRFRSVPLAGTARLIVALLTGGPLIQHRLLSDLVAAGLDRASARLAVDRFVACGAGERSTGLPDQVAGLAGAIAERLSAAPATAGVFRRLAAVEGRFGPAGPAEREVLLDAVRSEVESFRRAHGLAEPPRDAVRTLVFEDVGESGGPLNWPAADLAGSAEQFRMLHRFLPLVDHWLLVRLGMYGLFARLFGEPGECPDLLDFYRAYLSLAPGDAQALRSGWGDPAIAAVHRLRHRVAVELRGRSTGHTLDLDPAWLAGVCAAYPDFVPPWASATHKVQFFDQPRGGAGLVVNEIRSGWGTFASRACELAEPRPGQAMRDLLVTGGERQADLTAVLGLNYNLHPRLTRLSVEYPGCRSRPDDEALTLRDLGIRSDPATRRLFLFSRRDGRPVTLTPFNHLHPSAAPDLYQFLHSFVPSASYRGQLWDHRLTARPERTGDPVRLPRVVLGRVVLERRTWRFGVPAVRAAFDPAADDVDLLLAGLRWQRSHALPERCFFRVAAAVAGQRPAKPHYLDVRNPFLLRVLRGRLAAAPDNSDLVLQECLPDVDAYGKGTGLDSAEEIAIEVNLS